MSSSLLVFNFLSVPSLAMAMIQLDLVALNSPPVFVLFLQISGCASFYCLTQAACLLEYLVLLRSSFFYDVLFWYFPLTKDFPPQHPHKIEPLDVQFSLASGPAVVWIKTFLSHTFAASVWISGFLLCAYSLSSLRPCLIYIHSSKTFSPPSKSSPPIFFFISFAPLSSSSKAPAMFTDPCPLLSIRHPDCSPIPLLFSGLASLAYRIPRAYEPDERRLFP